MFKRKPGILGNDGVFPFLYSNLLFLSVINPPESDESTGQLVRAYWFMNEESVEIGGSCWDPSAQLLGSWTKDSYYSSIIP